VPSGARRPTAGGRNVLLRFRHKRAEHRSLKETLVEHCQRIGRDPAEITCSVNIRIGPDDGAGPAAGEAAAYREAGADLAIMNLPHRADPAILTTLAGALSPLA
jgi:hypothetical protein